MSLKFKNPGEQLVIVSSVSTGQSARFEAGEVVEVPETMKADCLAANLTLVGGKKTAATNPTKPEVVQADGDDNESTVNAG